jgi:hypothetical protein
MLQRLRVLRPRTDIFSTRVNSTKLAGNKRQLLLSSSQVYLEEIILNKIGSESVRSASSVIMSPMILTKLEPFTAAEIEQLKEQFEVYIKTVIDIEKSICSAGMDRHFEGENILLKQGSKQSDIWGGGIDLETKEIDFNSFINIRSRDNNTKNEIQSEEIRNKYKELTEYFFRDIL